MGSINISREYTTILSCVMHQSITFTYDGKIDTSESASKSESGTIEYASDVLLGRCKLAACYNRFLIGHRNNTGWYTLGQRERF
eukprot:4573386-Amphidinium_carterae.1